MTKTPVKLVVSDIDNTISDYFDIWAQEMKRGIEAVAVSRGIDITDEKVMENLYAEIVKIPTTGAIFHDFARMVREVPSFKLDDKSPEERKRLEKSDAKIAHDFQVNYAKGKSLYKGVIEMVDAMHEAGTPFVLYTDSPEDGAIRSLIHMGFPLDKLDGLVCRANDADEIIDGKKAPMQIDGGIIAETKAKLKEKLGDNYVVNSEKAWKSEDPIHKDGTPKGLDEPSVMLDILARYGVKPEEAVMVGDNIKSDGGFVRFGMNYAWQAHGAEVKDITVVMNTNLSDKKDYKIGREALWSQLQDMKKTDPVLGGQYDRLMVTLGTGFGELDKHFSFEKNAYHQIQQYKKSVRDEKKEATKETVKEEKKETSKKLSSVALAKVAANKSR